MYTYILMQKPNSVVLSLVSCLSVSGLSTYAHTCMFIYVCVYMTSFMKPAWHGNGRST